MREKQLILPMDYSVIIADDEPVRLLDEILDELDYTQLYEMYSSKGRKPAVPPIILFKICLLAMLEGRFTLREIKRQCDVNIHYMWLLQGYRVATHMTVGRFIKRLGKKILNDLFSQLMRAIAKRDSINFNEVFIDGTKLEAQANRYTFRWKKSVTKNLQKRLGKLEVLRTGVAKVTGVDTIGMNGDMLATSLKEFCLRQDITFVSGVGHHKHPLQKLHEECVETAGKINEYEKDLSIMGERNSYSKTDHDATFMRMKEDHMKNGQLKPAYNVQLAIHSEYIMGLGIFPNPNDTKTLIPFLKELSALHHENFRYVVADAGYDSEENFTWLSTHNYASVIKPNKYEIKKKSSYKEQFWRLENLAYDKDKDEYICAKGRRLTFTRLRITKTETGFKRQAREYTSGNCNRCGLRCQCQKTWDGSIAKANKQILVPTNYLKLQEDNMQRFKSKLGTQLRINRSIQSEGAFGVLKEDYRYKRVYRRGKESVYVELMLVAFGYNLRKLYNRMKSGRTGKQLFELKEVC